jgi:hypothetical protein
MELLPYLYTAEPCSSGMFFAPHSSFHFSSPPHTPALRVQIIYIYIYIFFVGSSFISSYNIRFEVKARFEPHSSEAIIQVQWKQDGESIE